MSKNINPDSVQSGRTCPANLGVRSCPVRKLICPVRLSPTVLNIHTVITYSKGEKFDIEIFSTLDRNKDSLITVEEYIQTFMTIKKNEAATLSKL